jgi:hypothetical protein
MKAQRFSETSALTRATRRYIPEDWIPYSHCCKSLISYIRHCYPHRSLWQNFAVQVANCFRGVKHRPFHIQMYSAVSWARRNWGICRFATSDETGVKECTLAEGIAFYSLSVPPIPKKPLKAFHSLSSRPTRKFSSGSERHISRASRILAFKRDIVLIQRSFVSLFRNTLTNSVELSTAREATHCAATR